jgi:glycine/D-amino acid oxidase-like deaminating enzyme
VVVIGGGMTGALIAHAFATAGIATILLEASHIGRGSTAASSALLLQEPDLELTELTNRYGMPHRHYPRQWFALGYGGNGMTFGFLAAQLLLERWQGHVTRDHALFEFGRTSRR